MLPVSSSKVIHWSIINCRLNSYGYFFFQKSTFTPVRDFLKNFLGTLIWYKAWALFWNSFSKLNALTCYISSYLCFFTERWLIQPSCVSFCLCVSPCIYSHYLTKNTNVCWRWRIFSARCLEFSLRSKEKFLLSKKYNLN